MPSASNNSEASSAYCIPIPKLTRVTSEPSRHIFAFPIGTVKSSKSGTSKLRPYNISFSKNTTGFGSRIADFNRPFASDAE